MLQIFAGVLWILGGVLWVIAGFISMPREAFVSYHVKWDYSETAFSVGSTNLIYKGGTNKDEIREYLKQDLKLSEFPKAKITNVVLLNVEELGYKPFQKFNK